jgi:dihydroorotase-like cyclic amidohydrolase
MVRLAVVSRQVVLFEKSIPCPAVILVEGDTIVDVIEFDPQTHISVILATYADWNPVDYSEFVVSPGQVDNSVKINSDWESIADASSAAVASGVTLMLVEANLHQGELDYSNLSCDVGQITVVSTAEDIRKAAEQRSVAVKGYLLPPNSHVPEIKDLPTLFATAREALMPIIIEPLAASERVFMVASPCRLKPYLERLTTEDNETSFAAAYPDEIQSSTSDTETGSHDRVSDFRSALLESSKKKSSKHAKYPLTPCRPYIKETEKMPDVFTALTRRLGHQNRGMQVLSQADVVTYVESGTTSFAISTEPAKEICKVVEEDEAAILESPRRMPSRRPSPILTDKKRTNSSSFSVNLNRLYNRYLANYPETWEEVGVRQVLQAFKAQPCRLHLANITSAAAYRELICARESRLDLTCEISASHLFFNSDNVKTGDTRFKASPPIRSEANRVLLWELLQLKVIDSVVSSHFAVSPVYKDQVEGNFRKAVSGLNNLGFTGSALWTLLHRSYSPHCLKHLITRHAKWTSLRPAKILGIGGSLGSIETGKRADFYIWDPYVTSTADKCRSSQSMTGVFIGQELMGSVKAVYVRGNLAYRDGRCLGVGSRLA